MNIQNHSSLHFSWCEYLFTRCHIQEGGFNKARGRVLSVRGGEQGVVKETRFGVKFFLFVAFEDRETTFALNIQIAVDICIKL